MPQFTIGDQDFQLEGVPFRILSGAIHYFRVRPEQWRDRIRKARYLGLNTIETYVPWNAHEPAPGEWREAGDLDLGRFLDIVAEEGMKAIVRPGPYICAEWSNGGLPTWLTRDPETRIRRSEPRYLTAAAAYLERVYRVVAPRQIDEGGPVILVQIENEYGAYGDDKEYLAELIRVARGNGITVPLVTVDQPTHEMLVNGRAEGAHMTGSFGSRSIERLAMLREHQPTGPLMCMEFWDGWFDDWGGFHQAADPASVARELDDLLRSGASVNLYMFHGGTNFGFGNGANHKGRYAAITTSYDYDAPLDEAGNPTAKYWAFREVIGRYTELPDEVPPPAAPAPSFDAPLAQCSALAPLLEQLGPVQHLDEPPTLDQLDHTAAFAVFETRLDADGAGVLAFGEIRDRAWVFLDGAPVGALSRESYERTIALPRARGTLRILVEDQGRVGYGPRIGEHKGLVGGVELDGAPLHGWDARPLDIGRIPQLALDHDPFASGQVVARAEFTLERESDLFLDTSGWGKGVAWVNGFCLGRYWRRGPQRTLYVPAPVTRAGSNVLDVLELEVLENPRAVFVPAPDLGVVEI